MRKTSRVICAVILACAPLQVLADGPNWIDHSQRTLTEKQRHQFRQNAERAACAATTPVAVAATAAMVGSSGTDSVITYQTTVTDIGGAWSSNNTFTAPCPGIYTFSVSFTTDSNYPCPTNVAGQDDVDEYFMLSSYPLYNDTHHVGSYALRGELADDVKRGQASYTLPIPLNKGDVIQVMVHSDGNGLRCLYLTDFSAVREAKLPS
ncbi:MAG TPA: hypothetical protein VMF58_03285 [Rhizomicrobium sp.]|nr:hypothetical protein [Rhizomicrobium sp.]